MSHKKIALVLSSGGARGYAHIGAIKALQEHGYKITAVVGASMGALIGGIYCAGKLDEATNWFCSLKQSDVIKMLDVSLSKNYVLKGQKVIDKLKSIVPDTPIEALPIPFRAIAADLSTQREVVFSKGSLYRAIRSSISIPSVFKPIKIAQHVLIDGGIVNPLPLNRVPKGVDYDLLVSINVSAPSSIKLQQEKILAQKKALALQSKLSVERILSSLFPDTVASNYMSLISSALELQIQRNTVQAQKITPPDIAVNIPINRFGVFDFHHAKRIIQAGYDETMKAIEQARQNTSIDRPEHDDA